MNRQAHASWAVRSFAVIALVACIWPAMLSAQVATGQISGIVRDPSGAPSAAVKVVIVSEQTSAQRTATTGVEGFYLVAGLPPGTYRVNIEHAGFKAFARQGIELTAGARVDISPTLQLGAITETVNVVAQGEQVETESGTVGSLVTGDQVRDLALNGRNLIQMIMLLPGVVTTTDLFDRGGIAQTGSVNDFYVNGTRSTSNHVTVDGGYNQDSGNLVSQTNNVSVDFVREVKVAASGYSAEYGRFAGGQINFTTRSGGTKYHGTLYEFLRNDKLNSRSFFAPMVEKLRLNQFGWTLSGPITLGRISTKADKKLFFFAGQEFRRRIDGETRRATLPTHAERSGVITTNTTLRYPSNFWVESLRGEPIVDPSRATEANPTGRNILPRQYMTANGLAIMKMFDAVEPMATLYEDVAKANNATYQLANVDIRREDIIRLDYQPSQKNQFHLRYLYDPGSGFSPYEMGTLPQFQATRQNNAQNTQVSWSTVFSTKTINEVSVVSNYLNLRRKPYGDLRFGKTYGFQFKEVFGNETEKYGIPSIAIAGYASISGARDERYSPVWDFSVRDAFSHLRGTHNLKTGFIFIRNRKNEQTYFTTGSVSFNPSGNQYTSGNAMTDALLGNFRQYTETDVERWVKIRFVQAESYFADTWKVRPNLTVDIGVRYYFLKAPVEAANTISTFLPEYYDPAKAQAVVRTGTNSGQLMPGVGVPYNGLVIPGTEFRQKERAPTDPAAQSLFKGLPRGFFHSQHKFSPRFGFAFDPWGKGNFSFRGGAAIYYDRLPLGIVDTGANPPFQSTITLFDGRMDDPAGGRKASFPAAISSYRPDVVFPATYNWNLGVQKKIPLGSLLDLNYVSTQGRHLLRKPNINQVHPAVQYAAGTSVNINALRPYQGYTNIALWESSASSSYHALQAGVTRRYASSLTYSVAYTWSKVLTDASSHNAGVEELENYRAERSHATFDRNHVLVVSYIYSLPFFNKGTGITRTLAGGWQLSGICQFQTGGWLTPSISTPTGGRRPDRVGDPKKLDPRKVQTLLGGNNQMITGNFYFDPTPGVVFLTPKPDVYGNSAPNIVRGPGRNNWDMSLFKNFKVNERWNFQFRGEAFNVWNHASFRNPNMSASGRDYGTISDAGPPRLIQFGVKLLF